MNMEKIMMKVLLIAIVLSPFISTSVSTAAQTSSVTGKYVFKDYRKGKGGNVNQLEITDSPNGRLHVSFELTYFYMAGRAETFHEGSGEGDGKLQGNVLTATLSDGAGGSCRVTMTFKETLIAGEYNVTVKSSSPCEINVVPDGVYKKEAPPSKVSRITAPRPSIPKTVLQAEVCPNPQAPCDIPAKKFAPYELSFKLPGKPTKGKTYESLPFYAVLIKTFPEESCDADDHTESIERERLRIQLAYPHNKVFAAYSCPNLDAVDYSFPGRMDASKERVLIMTFIAVYAGKTDADAKEFLSYVRTIYPSAELKKMTASYEVMDQ